MKLKMILHEILTEKMVVKKVNAAEFAKLVALAYRDAPEYDGTVAPLWEKLNKSNYNFWRKLLTRTDVIFCSEDKPPQDSITIDGKEYKWIEHPDPYATAQEMADDVKQNKRMLISTDFSDHPIFSMKDNIVFRAVHDYIVHILGNKPFGAYGEMQAYNLHAKLVPQDAKGAIFTEVVGQASYFTTFGNFPVQKITLLDGFDYTDVGKVSQEIIDKYQSEM